MQNAEAAASTIASYQKTYREAVSEYVNMRPKHPWKKFFLDVSNKKYKERRNTIEEQTEYAAAFVSQTFPYPTEQVWAKRAFDHAIYSSMHQSNGRRVSAIHAPLSAEHIRQLNAFDKSHIAVEFLTQLLPPIEAAAIAKKYNVNVKQTYDWIMAVQHAGEEFAKLFLDTKDPTPQLIEQIFDAVSQARNHTGLTEEQLLTIN